LAPDVLRERLAKRLEDNLGLSPENCRWAVESWELAMRVVQEGETPKKPLPPWQSETISEGLGFEGRVNLGHVVHGIWQAFALEPGVVVGGKDRAESTALTARIQLQADDTALARLDFAVHQAACGVVFSAAAVHYINPPVSRCRTEGSVAYGEFPSCQFSKRGLQEIAFGLDDHAIDLAAAGVSRAVLLYALNAIKGVVSHA
jgi:hypothetical protein